MTRLFFSFFLMMTSTLSIAAHAQMEKKFNFNYANVFRGESSMLEAAKTEAQYINTNFLSAHGLEIIIDSVSDGSMHKIEGRLKGKDCVIDAQLFKKVLMPFHTRVPWIDMMAGAGLIWPFEDEPVNRRRAQYILVPACTS